VFEVCLKKLPLTPQVIGDARPVNSCFFIALRRSRVMLASGLEKNCDGESDEVAKATR
jgi:hypothetical protein